MIHLFYHVHYIAGDCCCRVQVKPTHYVGSQVIKLIPSVAAYASGVMYTIELLRYIRSFLILHTLYQTTYALSTLFCTFCQYYA